MINLFINEMSERLLIVLLWDVFHRSIHRRAPRAFPWGRNLPRRHFRFFFGFFVKLFSTTSFHPVLPGEIGWWLNCETWWVWGLYRVWVSKGAGTYLCTFPGGIPTPAQTWKTKQLALLEKYFLQPLLSSDPFQPVTQWCLQNSFQWGIGRRGWGLLNKFETSKRPGFEISKTSCSSSVTLHNFFNPVWTFHHIDPRGVS